MKHSIVTLLAIPALLSPFALAQPPGRGQGPGGPGRGGGGGGPLPAEQQETIHRLFSGHKSIHREVTLTEKGYKSITTSKDPEVVTQLQKHIAFMEKRLDSGFPVRRWDPAYEEFFRHYDQLAVKVTNLENGVEVEVTAKTPEAIKVARNHASIISGFVEKGEVEHHAKHPAVLDGNAEGARPAEAAQGCEHCKKACKCDREARKDAPAPQAKETPKP